MIVYYALSFYFFWLHDVLDLDTCWVIFVAPYIFHSLWLIVSLLDNEVLRASVVMAATRP